MFGSDSGKRIENFLMEVLGLKVKATDFCWSVLVVWDYCGLRVFVCLLLVLVILTSHWLPVTAVVKRRLMFMHM